MYQQSGWNHLLSRSGSNIWAAWPRLVVGLSPSGGRCLRLVSGTWFHRGLPRSGHSLSNQQTTQLWSLTFNIYLCLTVRSTQQLLSFPQRIDLEHRRSLSRGISYNLVIILLILSISFILYLYSRISWIVLNFPVSLVIYSPGNTVTLDGGRGGSFWSFVYSPTRALLKRAKRVA